jgi:GH35 family endo-1,4-beta-xylanase
VLKNYVNREANPNFKLGTGVDVTAFLNQGSAYSASVSNFDELTADKAMIYNSVVDNKGVMNTVNVMKFTRLAKEAGASIYGHTLVWHAQQRRSYLMNMVEEAAKAGNGGHALKMTSPGGGQNWSAQTWYQLASPLTAGTSYSYTFMVRGSGDYNMSLFLQEAGGDAQEYSPTAVQVTEEWTEVTSTFKPVGSTLNKVTFNFGDFTGDIWIDNVSLVADGTTTNLIPNGTFEDPYTNGTPNGGPGWASYGNYQKLSDNGEGYSTGGAGGPAYALKLAGTGGGQSYEAQAFYKFDTPFVGGTEYTLTMMVKGTAAYSGMQVILQDDPYVAWPDSQYDGPSQPVTEKWEEVTYIIKPTASTRTKLMFNFGNFVGDIFIDNMSLTAAGSTANMIPNSDFEAGNIDGWSINGSRGTVSLSADGEGYSPGASTPLPPEVQVANLTAELDRWIGGMMKATEGYVTAWDVVNEPMDDANPTELKKAPSAPEDNDFYWQDYLGKDYARVAIKIAREKYAEQENSSPLLLFVNDYGLENGDNAKAVGLIDMIEYWEEDGTVIDGIGTQMHVSYSEDPATQAAQEASIENMFKLLAASGKLIKISELNMVIKNAAGEDIFAGDMTFEQQQAMANFYKFIIQKYLELVPASQQYGITQWSSTDASSLPLGLWDSAYKRKPTYAGFAEGLGGKPVPEAPAAE